MAIFFAEVGSKFYQILNKSSKVATNCWNIAKSGDTCWVIKVDRIDRCKIVIRMSPMVFSQKTDFEINFV